MHERVAYMYDIHIFTRHVVLEIKNSLARNVFKSGVKLASQTMVSAVLDSPNVH